MANETLAVEEKSFYEEGTSKRTGLLGWITSTDHKRIGLLYLYAIGQHFLLLVQHLAF
jgi:cytochrome c oxidase subunit 1